MSALTRCTLQASPSGRGFVGSMTRVLRRGSIYRGTNRKSPLKACREAWADKTLDDKYSSRHIDLDQLGYYIIWVDKDAREIVADFYTNIINKDGIACDPETGKPIPCSGSKRIPTSTYRARTAKEMQIKLVEKEEKTRVTCIDHAMYLGREFARAEMSLMDEQFEYVQD